MPTPRPIALASIILAPLALAACSGGGGGQAADDAGAVTAQTPAGITDDRISAPADFNVADACSLVDRTIIGEMMGSPVRRATLGDQVTVPTATTAGFSNCTFELENGLKPQLLARWSPDPESRPAEAVMKETADAFGKPAEPIPGMKQPTFWMAGPDQLHIFPADRRRYLIWTMMLVAPDGYTRTGQDKAKGWAVEIAKRSGY